MDAAHRRAACSCGALSVSVHGEPARVGMCHCLACQRRTGSAFGVAAFFPRDQIDKIDGPRTAWSRVAESGATLTFNFCPTCGSTVYWERDSRPGMLIVALGAFADPDFPGPIVVVWADCRHPWLDTLGELERSARQ
jgi:hypothetical protein